MDIFTEKRLGIFKFAFGPRLYPVSTVPGDQNNDPVAHGNAAVHWGFGCYNFNDCKGRCHDISLVFQSKHTTADYSVPRPNLALLQVSKQVGVEGRVAGWADTRKSFTSIYQLTSVFDTGRKPDYTWLTKVLLNLDMSDWFNFLGVRVSPHLYMKSLYSLGYRIPALPELSDLQLWFQSPDDGWECSPRAKTGTKPHLTSAVSAS
jgi:hypothetical protein